MVGFIGGLIAAIITIFKKHLSMYTVPIYAIFEGLALGLGVPQMMWRNDARELWNYGIIRPGRPNLRIKIPL